MATPKAYGSWLSTVSSNEVAGSSNAFQELHLDRSEYGRDDIYWSELYPSKGGTIIVFKFCGKTGEISQVTNESFSCRTTVHEYGGGSFFVWHSVVFFSNFSDQRIYMQKTPTAAAEPITRSWWYRYADGEHSNAHAWKFDFVCVREDHAESRTNPKAEPINTIVQVRRNTEEETILVSGADFYSSPRISPDDEKLCWIQWDHPNMPWDDVELWVAEFTKDKTALKEETKRKIAGGAGTSVICPKWKQDNTLLFISDQKEWWNLYHCDSDGKISCLIKMEKEIGGPEWQFGSSYYSCDPNKEDIIAVSYDGELALFNSSTTDYEVIDTGFKSHRSIHFDHNGQICCIASSPACYDAVIRVDTNTGEVKILRGAKSGNVDKAYVSIPEKISFPTSNGDIAYGNYYPPKNPRYEGLPDTCPPLLVKAHGGPTSRATTGMQLKIQYYTTRGFAVLDVDYRGSTGYGKKYRHSLRCQFGVYDVDDCCYGAKYLVKEKKAAADKLCISGGSSGGYVVLAALAFRDTFHAGASHYGIADLEVLAQETHKFESRYIDRLIGPYPEMATTYKERSPINYVHQLTSPIAFFQGDEDKIVPPNQSLMMYESVKGKGIPTTMVMYKGEQHGFRKAENIIHALDSEFYFFCRIFGIQPSLSDVKLKIDNLD